jgi:hypothetical protein
MDIVWRDYIVDHILDVAEVAVLALCTRAAGVFCDYRWMFGFRMTV